MTKEYSSDYCWKQFHVVALFRKALSDWIKEEKGFEVFGAMVNDNDNDTYHLERDDDDHWADQIVLDLVEKLKGQYTVIVIVVIVIVIAFNSSGCELVKVMVGWRLGVSITTSTEASTAKWPHLIIFIWSFDQRILKILNTLFPLQ